MRLIELQIYNRAPFENLKLSMDDSKIYIFSGINGVGKTTILSYIVDAFYEFAKKGFVNSFEGINSKFYRVSSNLTAIDSNKISFVYMRFEHKGEFIDYIDVRQLNNEYEYNEVIQLENVIPYSTLQVNMKSKRVLKYFNVLDEAKVEKLFDNNILTYFPAYRYEQPAYLNDPYAVSLNFKKEMDFAGYLTNPIEVTTNLPEIANWIMDIVLDSELYKGVAHNVLEQLNMIFSTVLTPKIKESVKLGIGPRHMGAVRIQIVKKKDGKNVYPSIFNMSSGEMALISLFCECIRQADRLGKTFDKVDGIVLVDEIDKHLHIKMQKEVLPNLIKLFPNVQFIVTSHSPFLNLGFSCEDDNFYKICDMDNGGISCKPQNNKLFEEVYQILISENERFAEKYNLIISEVKKSNKPLLITEGKTDWKHLKAAMQALGIVDIDIEICEYDETMGDETLIELLEQLHIISSNRKIIGMFDCDNENIWEKICSGDKLYVELSKNIFAFSIPVVNKECYGKYTSIEHYYKERDLLKEDDEGRRLFLGKEFYNSGNSKCQKYQTRCSQIQNKVAKNGVIDEKVYKINEDPELKKSVALSKNKFAQMILDKDKFAEGFDFTEFSKIFDVIREILSA